MSDAVLRIEKMENGYEVEICDPKIMEANAKPKSAYADPWKSYAFTTAEEAVAFVGKHLDTLKPPPDADAEYSEAFDQATTKE